MKTNIDFIRKYELLPYGSRVLCAVSGGRDSVYLLHRLLEWSKDLQLTVLAAHYNHCLRGEESERDAQFVSSLCQSLDVPVFMGRGDVAKYAAENGLGVEEAARKLRYAFLEEIRESCGAEVIATAHHAEDQAETMLFQLARGSGTRGLSGIPPRRGNIVRPILMTTRREIDDYLLAHGISYVEDSTNEQDGYHRNVIRHHVMPVLQQINPSFSAHAARSALLLREDDAYLEKQAQLFLQSHPIEDGIDGGELLELAYPIAARVIRRVWGSAMEYEHVQQVLSLCGGNKLAYAHVPGAVIRFDRGRLWTEAEEMRYDEISLAESFGDAMFGEVRVRWELRTCTADVHNSFNTFCVKCESIKGVVKVSSRREGDCVKFAGSDHRKKLKKLFQEKNYTKPQRAAIPVFRDDEGIVAVNGFGIAERCVPEIGDQIIYIQCDK